MTKTALRAIVSLRRAGFTLAEIDAFDDAEFLAYSVAVGEAEGGVFDWDQMQWRTSRGD